MVPPPTHDADRTDPPPSSPWPAQRNPDIPTPSSPRPHQSISPPQPAANPFTTLATSRPHAVAGGRPNRPAISWDHATSLRDVEEAEEGAPRDVRELERDRDREERERQRGTAVGAPVARREDQGPLDPFSDSYRAEVASHAHSHDAHYTHAHSNNNLTVKVAGSAGSRGSSCSASDATTEVPSLDRSYRSSRSSQQPSSAPHQPRKGEVLPYPAVTRTASLDTSRNALRSPTSGLSTAPAPAYLHQPFQAIQRVWRGIREGGMASPEPAQSEDLEMDGRSPDPATRRKLSLAYLQDASPLPPDLPQSSVLDHHRFAAMRHKHARFSKFTLSFLDNQVEEDYRTYFWTRSVTRWRCFVAIAGFLVAAFQIASLLGKGGDGITESASATDWVIVALVALVPMLGIALISYLVSPQRMARWIHYISFLFLLVIGPILTCIRYVHFSSTSSPPHAVNPSVTAPIYIVCLVSSVFFLRLRFVHALLATAVAAPTWYIVFGAELSNGADPSVTGGYLVSSVALFFACVVTCSISYDLEQTLRTQYLSDSRFLSITRNLQSQLEGLERSLLAASGKDNITLADLDSPLEKAMLAVRSLLLDGRLSRDQKNVLDLVMACLSSPNLLTPDLDRQVKRGEVEMDVEVEKWLFNEVARRKRLTSDPDEVGQVQLTPPNDDEDDDDEGGDGLEVNSLPGKMIATAAEPCDASIASVADAANGAIVVGGPRRRSASSTALVPTLVFEAGSISGLYTARTVTYLNRLDEFNFPIFEFAKECGAHPLLIMSHRLCVGSGLVGRLGLNADKFVSCMATIELGYHSDLAFHNSLHAADVLHCINYFLNLPTVGTLFSDLEQLSILLAATIHDFDHPGVNNHFLIASSDRRALLYNDKSVLENHHCASAFEVMSRKECAFLGSLDRADFKTVREAVVEMVLATDLAQHFSLLTMFKKKVLTAETFDPVGTREDRTLLMQMLMKCADVSNPTKAWPEYNEWILRITEEWFRQGDREKLLGLPVSPFCDRDGTTLTRPAPAQNSFINFIVYPLFDAFHAWTPLGEVKRGLEMNRAKWAAVIAAEKEEEARVAAAAAGIASPSSAKAKRRSGSLPTPPRPRRNRSFPALPGLTTGVATLEVGEEEEDEGTAGSVRRGSAAPPLSASIVLRRGEGLASAEKRWRRRSGPPGWLTLEEGGDAT